MVALARTFSVKEKPCLIPNLRGRAFSLSPLSVMLAVDFWFVFFIKLGKFLSVLLEENTLKKEQRPSGIRASVLGLG